MKKKLSLLLLLVAFMPLGVYATNGNNTNIKKLLVINSYHEDELWANRMTQPIEVLAAKNDTVLCDQLYLNNSAIADMKTYNEICDNIFAQYANNPPEYVVLLGNFAFTLRDRIKKEWGDIPFLLISRIETYAPVEQYITSNSTFDVNGQKPLGQLRSDYNFTAVIVPDCYHENLALITGLMPNLEKLVFMSDKAYVNKIAAMNIEALIKERYPHIQFDWLQASEDKRLDMIYQLTKPHPNTAFLLSSWGYEITTARGMKAITSRDLVFLPEAANPVFTMRQIYTGIGCVGGVFSDNDACAEKIEELVNAMIQGKDMSKIPFFIPEAVETTVDYNLLQKFNLSTDNLPAGTIVRNRPPQQQTINTVQISVFEKHWKLFASIFGGLILVILIVAIRNKLQRKQIELLERHSFFVNNIPMPYTKAILWLDDNENVVNIKYDLKNTAYEELIEKNSLPNNPLHLFSNSYMSDIVHKLLTTDEPASIRHHFKHTDTYCYFIFVPYKNTLNTKNGKKNSKGVAKLEVDVFAIDITKDHLLQQRLKDQAVTIDISMEMAQLIPWQWDAQTNQLSFYTYNGNVNFASSTTTTTTKDGKSASVLTVEEFLGLMPPADAEKMMQSYAATLRGEKSDLDAEYRLRRMGTEDEYDWCESHGVVTDTDSDGKPLRMTGSLQLITERKEQEEKMTEALNKAKESDMLKSAFLANMSHEIRTPLNAIVGFSNLLTTTDDPAERQEFAGIINSNNELLLSLINDILDLAKIESNTITLTYDLCDIHDLVSSISRTISIRVPKGVRLNVAHYADSCIVKADAAHISQVLINLLTNATKFTKRGSITVGYEVIDDENKLYFYVKDTGIGISKENIEKVFDRFVKFNNFVQGSGLGLAICRTLIEKMGGEIGVESPGEGRGTTFWFTIPYDPMDLKIAEKDRETTDNVIHNAFKNDHIIGEHADRPAKVEEESSSIGFKTPNDISNNALASIPDGLTVLSVEDNPSNTWLMDRLIQHKFSIVHAENGRIALEKLDEAKPDIVIMDINMPEMDGYEAVAEMRKRGVEVPIIAVTAYAFASDRVRILNSGFDAFVSKPVSASILYETLVDVWGKKHKK